MANSSSLKTSNITSILEIVRKHSPISIPEIAKLSGITAVTANTLVKDLVSSKYLLESGVAISSGGRRAQLYKFSGDSHYIIGINLRESDASIGLFTLNGIMNSVQYFKISKDISIEETIESINSEIHELINTNKILYDEIIGISIISPGIVDNHKGIIKSISKLPQWNNVPICDIISSFFGLPVLLTRDTDAAALYLKWLHSDENNNLLFISIDEGIGSGAHFSSGLFEGSHGYAGELGHTTVDIDGPLCSCGNRGCLELYANNHSILSKYMEYSNQVGLKPLVTTEDNYIKEKQNIIKLSELANSGNQIADKSLRYASDYIVVLLINALRAYDVSEIIIECPWLKNSPTYFNKILTDIYLRTPYLNRSELKVNLNTVDNIFTKASFISVANKIFEPGCISDKFFRLEKNNEY